MKRSFTLIELLVVIGIIGILLAMVAPVTMQMMEDAENKSAYARIQGMLKVARSNAQAKLTSYGICFYVDRLTNKQYAAFIRWGGAPPAGYGTGPYWNRYAERMVTVPGKIYSFPPAIRVRSLESPYPNTFVVVFDSRGSRATPTKNHRYVIHDPDQDTIPDNLGDVLGMPVMDIVNQWHLYSDPLDPGSNVYTWVLDVPVEDIVDLDGPGDMPYTEFENSWGLLIYNHADYTDLLIPGDDSEAENYIVREGEPMHLSRWGDVIRGPRGE